VLRRIVENRGYIGSQPELDAVGEDIAGWNSGGTVLGEKVDGGNVAGGI